MWHLSNAQTIDLIQVWCVVERAGKGNYSVPKWRRWLRFTGSSGLQRKPETILLFSLT